MKYIVSWTLPQGTFNAAVARFLETGGAPPQGVKLLGRWHGMSGAGFAITESDDAKAMLRLYRNGESGDQSLGEGTAMMSCLPVTPMPCATTVCPSTTCATK